MDITLLKNEDKKSCTIHYLGQHRDMEKGTMITFSITIVSWFPKQWPRLDTYDYL